MLGNNNDSEYLLWLTMSQALFFLLFYLFLDQIFEDGTTVILIFQMHNLRARKVKKLAQDHKDN